MAYFISKLEVTMIDNDAAQGRGEWALDEDFSYYSDVARMKITAPKGFHTDFASVPRLPIVFWLAGDTSTEAAAAVVFCCWWQHGLSDSPTYRLGACCSASELIPTTNTAGD